MTRAEVYSMDRVALILAVQGLINDPDIRTEDLEDEELRKLLLSVEVKHA